MSNFLLVKFMLQSIWFFAIQQSITANSNGCNTPKLKATDRAVITIFDSQYKFGDEIWALVCDVVQRFPPGLVSVEYRPGALASGTGNNVKCGTGDCKLDIFHSCKSRSKNYNSCFEDTDFKWPQIFKCYCAQDSIKQLLENAALRAAWKVPESAVPTLVVNKTYDPCIRFGNAAELIKYLCVVYQKQTGGC